jgi:hypothetical protein
VGKCHLQRQSAALCRCEPGDVWRPARSYRAARARSRPCAGLRAYRFDDRLQLVVDQLPLPPQVICVLGNLTHDTARHRRSLPGCRRHVGVPLITRTPSIPGPYIGAEASKTSTPSALQSGYGSILAERRGAGRRRQAARQVVNRRSAWNRSTLCPRHITRRGQRFNVGNDVNQHGADRIKCAFHCVSEL